MTKRYSRIPAASVLVAAIALGALYLLTWNRIAGANASSRALDELEALIAADHADANTWDAYGHKLHELKRYDRAIVAYRKALELEPLHREARIHCAIALLTSSSSASAARWAQPSRAWPAAPPISPASTAASSASPVSLPLASPSLYANTA